MVAPHETAALAVQSEEGEPQEWIPEEIEPSVHVSTRVLLDETVLIGRLQRRQILVVELRWAMLQDHLDGLRQILLDEGRPQNGVSLDDVTPGGLEISQIQRPAKGEGHLDEVGRRLRIQKSLVKQTCLHRRQRIHVVDVLRLPAGGGQQTIVVGKRKGTAVEVCRCLLC